MRIKVLAIATVVLAAWAIPALAQELAPPTPPEAGEPEPKQQEKELTLQEEIEKLIGELGAADTSVRDTAVKRLTKIGLPAVQALEKALDSENTEARFQAKKILEELHYVTKKDRGRIEKHIELCLWGSEPKEADEETTKLIELLSSEDWQAREDAVKKLIEKGLPALREVSKLLDSDDIDRRDRAEKIVNAIRDKAKPQFKEQFRKSLEEVEYVKTAPYYLAEVLTKKGEELREQVVANFLRATAGLMTMADLRDPQRRRGGSLSMTTMNGVTRVILNGVEVQIISENASPDNVLAFIASEEKMEKDLRLLALKALGVRGATCAVEKLIGLLGKARGGFLLEAADTLRKLTGQEFGPTKDSSFDEVDKALEEWEQWWEQNKDKAKYRLSEAPANQDPTGRQMQQIGKQIKGLLKRAKKEQKKKDEEPKKEEKENKPKKEGDKEDNKERDF